MNKLHTLKKAEAGIAHLGAILLLVLVLAAVGFAGYTVMNQDVDDSGDVSTSQGANSQDPLDKEIEAEEQQTEKLNVDADKEPSENE